MTVIGIKSLLAEDNLTTLEKDGVVGDLSGLIVIVESH